MLSTLWPARGNYLQHRALLAVDEDVSYTSDSAHPKLRFDVFAPAMPPAPSLPTVFFVHGGAWKEHDRKHHRALSGLYSNVGAAFAREGFIGVVVGYRQPPEATLPEALEDVRAALRAWASLGGAYGADPSRSVLVGHGAGGHLALALVMLGGDALVSVRAAASLMGFYDIERYAQALGVAHRGAFDKYCGLEPSVAPALSPQLRVRDINVPVLLGMCEQESDALRAEHRAMETALRDVRKPVESFLAHGCGHMGLVLQMGAEQDAVTPALAAFARKYTHG